MARLLTGAALALLLLTAGCGAGASGGAAAAGAPPTTTTPGSGTAGRSDTATSATPPGTGSAGAGGGDTATCPLRTFAALSDRQRAGQVFLVGVPTTTAAATATGIAAATATSAGGYLLYGGTDASSSRIRALTDKVSAQLAARAGGVRPFVAADQEGGQIQPLSGAGFSTMPPALVQGTWSPARLESSARQWGTQLRQAGVNVDFAPVVDVVPAELGTTNGPIGHYRREFGHTPDVVAQHAVAVVRGLQSAGIAATAKHFPGLGRVIDNTDTAAGVVDRTATPTDPALQPYVATIAAGVRFVMVSSASYPQIDPDHLAVFSPTTMSLLRGTFGFRGLIASDDLGAATQVAAVPPGQRAIEFLAAGGQVVVAVRPASVVRTMVAAVTERMGADPGFRQQVDAAALAVLTTKHDLGLLTC